MPYDLAILTEVGEALWVRAAGQARVQRLAQLPQVQMLDLSPDGRTLIVELSHGLLALVDLPDGDPRPLTRLRRPVGGQCGHPAPTRCPYSHSAGRADA